MKRSILMACKCSSNVQTINLRVSKVVRAANDSILLFLETPEGKQIHYQAGQFITFIFHRRDQEVRRSYSFFTTPFVDAEAGVLVKRLINGEISRHLIDHVAAGDILEALPPSGRFTLATDRLKAGQLVFIAAGSGISPVISLIKQALYLDDASTVVLIYQSRSEASTLFHQELSMMSREYKQRFTCIILLSNPANHQLHPSRLNNTLLEQILLRKITGIASSQFYLCGPPAFMRMCQFVLHVLKVADEKIHREIFFFEGIPAAPLIHDKTLRNVTVHFNGKQFSFPVEYPETILQAALKSGLKLPYSCKGGRCSTCTVRCISGSVKMSINEVLTDKDLHEGLILTCVGYPQSDLELTLN